MMMKKLGLTITAAMSLAFAAGSANANLLSDGDFESFDSMVANGNYTKLDAPGPLGAWTVGGASVDLIQNAYGSITNVSVDLAGTPGPGSLTQGFMAQAGYQYTLTFDHFRNGAGTSMTVQLGTSLVVIPAPAAVTNSSLVWTAASTGMANVVFSSGAGNYGPTTDNVVPTAVPEPGTYAMLLAGLGTLGFVSSRRRRQG